MPTVQMEEQFVTDAVDASDVSSISSFEDVAEDDNDELTEYENKVELEKRLAVLECSYCIHM
jgi:hypothetical protein